VKGSSLIACDSCMLQQKTGPKLFVALLPASVLQHVKPEVLSCMKPAKHMCACMVACSASCIVCNELYTCSYRLCIALL